MKTPLSLWCNAERGRYRLLVSRTGIPMASLRAYACGLSAPPRRRALEIWLATDFAVPPWVWEPDLAERIESEAAVRGIALPLARCTRGERARSLDQVLMAIEAGYGLAAA